jgi:proline dehydrogenase
MLGESARSSADALRYFESYSAAIRAIGDAAAGRPAFEAPLDLDQALGAASALRGRQ